MVTHPRGSAVHLERGSRLVVCTWESAECSSVHPDRVAGHGGLPNGRSVAADLVLPCMLLLKNWAARWDGRSMAANRLTPWLHAAL